MPCTLRVISINFPFQNKDVVFESSFSTSRALFDFDVVVVRPYSFHPSADKRAGGGKFGGNWDEVKKAKQEMSGKVEDLRRLLDQGGLLVIILDVMEMLVFTPQTYSVSETYSVTNYDF